MNKNNFQVGAKIELSDKATQHFKDMFALQEESDKKLKELENELSAIYNAFSPEKKQSINSSAIYTETLESLLENKEFCKSDVWVKYIKHQISEFHYYLDEVSGDPCKIEGLIQEYGAEKLSARVTSKAGKVSAEPYRIVEKQIISRAIELLSSPHDSRPPDRYRTSSLAEAILYTNRDETVPNRLSLPALSSIIRYLKQAVDEGELPLSLIGKKPKKW